jgi:hypothetical protein
VENGRAMASQSCSESEATRPCDVSPYPEQLKNIIFPVKLHLFFLSKKVASVSEERTWLILAGAEASSLTTAAACSMVRLVCPPA